MTRLEPERGRSRRAGRFREPTSAPSAHRTLPRSITVADDYITAHLNRLFDGALQPRRQRQVERHWTAYPPLAGRAPREVATIVADAYHPDHNLVAGALLAAHRDRAG